MNHLINTKIAFQHTQGTQSDFIIFFLSFCKLSQWVQICTLKLCITAFLYLPNLPIHLWNMHAIGKFVHKKGNWTHTLHIAIQLFDALLPIFKLNQIFTPSSMTHLWQQSSTKWCNTWHKKKKKTSAHFSPNCCCHQQDDKWLSQNHTFLICRFWRNFIKNTVPLLN